MKSNIVRFLKLAAEGGQTPKALVKMGHWHVMVGQNRSAVNTVGSMLDGIARWNGLDTLSIAITVVNEEGQHWSITDYEEFELIFPIADSDRWRILDLRPLRDSVYGGEIETTPEFEEWLYGYDMLLLLGDTRKGTWQWMERAKSEKD